VNLPEGTTLPVLKKEGALQASLGQEHETSPGNARASSLARRRLPALLLGALLVILISVAGFLLYDRGRPAPIPYKQKLFDGAVTYHRRVYYFPRIFIAHVLAIDLKAGSPRLLVTPPDNAGDAPLNARTTSQFLEEYDLQIAINGDGFHPWWSRSPLDYYPQPGDPITPNGFAASGGKVYAEGQGQNPILYISRRNALSFREPGKVHHAISGDRYLVLNGEAVADLDNSEREPRTALGFNKNGRWLILVVVDGRQPFYSEGATFSELADILLAHGAHFGMSLDGGGSSTLVIEGGEGEAIVLNSPIDQYIPGRERPVANHLGIYINR